MPEEDHSNRLTTVEQRTETLAKEQAEFREQYEADRKENRENFQRVFAGIDTLNRNMAGAEATKGRVPLVLIFTILGIIPTIFVPVVTLLGVFMWQTVNPLTKTLEERRDLAAAEHNTLIETRINQARLEERQQFILSETHESYEHTKN